MSHIYIYIYIYMHLHTCGFSCCSRLLIPLCCNKINHSLGNPVNSPVWESKPTWVTWIRLYGDDIFVLALLLGVSEPDDDDDAWLDQRSFFHILNGMNLPIVTFISPTTNTAHHLIEDSSKCCRGARANVCDYAAVRKSRLFFNM